jgi:hypothetical protein
MSPMVGTITWIVIVPLAVVYGDLHFGRIAMIEAIATAVVLVPVEILRVVDVRIVLESRVVATASTSPPRPTVGVGLLSLRFGLDC